MSGQKVGYVRVSSVDQNTARQLSDLTLDKIFTDKLSGKNTERPQLLECISYIRSGDEMYVHSIDRLARNLQDLQNIVEEVTSKGAIIIFVTENLRFSGNDDPMSKMLMQFMGAIAEFNRNLIATARNEGIEKAKAAGKYKGRKALCPTKVQAIEELAALNIKKSVVAYRLDISERTVYKYWPKEDK